MSNLKTILITLTILVFLYAVAVSGAVWWVLSAKMSNDTGLVEQNATQSTKLVSWCWVGECDTSINYAEQALRTISDNSTMQAPPCNVNGLEYVSGECK